MGWKVARCGYWLVIVLGTVLLFGREQEFHILKIIFGVGLPVAFIWACCTSFRRRLLRRRSGWRRWRSQPWMADPPQSCRLPCRVTGVSVLYFAGLIDLKSVR